MAMHRGIRGFTLLELLIALSLVALISTLLYSSLRTAAMTWERTKDRSETFEEARLVQEFLNTSLRQAVPVERGGKHQKGLWFDGSARRLEFAGVLPLHRGVGGVYLLRLGVSGFGAHQNLTFRYRLLRDAAARPHPRWQRTKVLLDGLNNVNFSYYGSRKAGSRPVWQADWHAVDHLPQLVRLRYASATEGRVDLILPLEAQRKVPIVALASTPSSAE